jgi:hypothetical protein
MVTPLTSMLIPLPVVKLKMARPRTRLLAPPDTILNPFALAPASKPSNSISSRVLSPAESALVLGVASSVVSPGVEMVPCV